MSEATRPVLLPPDGEKKDSPPLMLRPMLWRGQTATAMKRAASLSRSEHSFIER
jgi:hypothetical protein